MLLAHLLLLLAAPLASTFLLPVGVQLSPLLSDRSPVQSTAGRWHRMRAPLLEAGTTSGDEDGDGDGDGDGDEDGERDGVGSRSVFNWSTFSRPEEYILFTRRREPLPREGGLEDDTIRVDFRKPITWLGLLFFVPVFSSEFFFAISRAFICDLPAVPGLCQAVS